MGEESEVVLLGGREPIDVRILDYDPSWPERFERHRQRISAALESTAHSIEHIGSTAVPGLAAKPIVDVLVTVDDPDRDESFVPTLEMAGYQLRVIEPGHRMFRTPDRDAHVHVWQVGCEEARAYLLFRDWLRHNASSRELYVSTKRRLAENPWADMNDYAEAKTPVVTELQERAGRWATVTGWQPGNT